MRWIIGLICCLLPLIGIAAGNTYEYRLQNGLKLIVREDHRAPVVMSSVWYKVGGSYEHDGITGISHMLEHMMFKGTKRFGPGVLNKLINENGGVQNAITTADFTMYYQKLSASNLQLSFELESDRMRNLILREEPYEKEHQVVMEERRMRIDDSPQALTWERFNAAAFLNNPYHHPVIGWMTDIRHLTLQDLKKWYQTWYSPNNAAIIVVGDVKAAYVFDLAKKYFGPIKATEVPKLKPRENVPSVGPKKVIVTVPAKVPWFIMGFNVPVLKTVQDQWKAYALYVLASILDSGTSGRLVNDLVRGKQIAVSASCEYDLYSLHSNVLVLEGTPAANHSINELKKAFLDEIADLKKKPITTAELKRVKAQTIANTVYKKDSMMNQAFEIGYPEMSGLSWRDSDAFVSRIQAVTPQQVQAVAKEFLLPKNRTTGILKPGALPKKGPKHA